MDKAIRRLVVALVISAFSVTSLATPPAFAQEMPVLPVPGVMVSLSPAFTPASIKAITINPDNALAFDFLIDQGDLPLSPDAKKEEYQKLAKYFLASLAIPEEDLWVNLSPYEKQRIIPEAFGKTEMGRDLLAMDYVLKQITASLIYPEEGLGKEFWDKVYRQAYEQFGTTQVPVNTFNKVWITPDVAEVYEKGNTVFLIKSHLKVMLEEDYLSMTKNLSVKGGAQGADQAVAGAGDINKLGNQIVREVILPAIEKEVNEGKNFATLRQLNDALILATWYKKALKDSLLGKVYANRGKVKGVDQPDVKANEEIYQQYLKAFKKGVFNFIKEDTDRYTQEVIPRKYFSGGYALERQEGPDGAILGFSERVISVSKSAAIAVIKNMTSFQLDSAKVVVLETSDKASQSLVAKGDEVEQLVKKEQVLDVVDGEKEIWVRAGKRLAYRVYVDPKTQQLFLTGYSANGSKRLSSTPRMLNYVSGDSNQGSREFFVGSAINDSSVKGGRAYSVNDTGLADTHFSVISERRSEGGYDIRVLANAPALVRKNVQYKEGQVVFDGIFDATTFSVNQAMTAKTNRSEELKSRVWGNQDQEIVIEEALKTYSRTNTLSIPAAKFGDMLLIDFLEKLGINPGVLINPTYGRALMRVNSFDPRRFNIRNPIRFALRTYNVFYDRTNIVVPLEQGVSIDKIKKAFSERVRERKVLDELNRGELKALGSKTEEIAMGKNESVFLRAEEGSSSAEKDQYSFKISRLSDGRLSIEKYSFDGSTPVAGNASFILPAGQDARVYNLVFQDIDLDLLVGSQKLRVDVVDRGDGGISISKMLPAESRGYSGLRYRTYTDHQQGKKAFLDAAMASKRDIASVVEDMIIDLQNELSGERVAERQAREIFKNPYSAFERFFQGLYGVDLLTGFPNMSLEQRRIAVIIAKGLAEEGVSIKEKDADGKEVEMYIKPVVLVNSENQIRVRFARADLMFGLGKAQLMEAVLTKLRNLQAMVQADVTSDLPLADMGIYMREAMRDDAGNIRARTYSDAELSRVFGDKKDSAMGSPTDLDPNVGGIDLNPAFQNLQIKRDGAGVPLPISQQNIDQINLEGLIPVIKSITPAINLPIFAEILSEAAVPQAS